MGDGRGGGRKLTTIPIRTFSPPAFSSTASSSTTLRNTCPPAPLNALASFHFRTPSTTAPDSLRWPSPLHPVPIPSLPHPQPPPFLRDTHASPSPPHPTHHHPIAHSPVKGAKQHLHHTPSTRQSPSDCHSAAQTAVCRGTDAPGVSAITSSPQLGKKGERAFLSSGCGGGIFGVDVGGGGGVGRWVVGGGRWWWEVGGGGGRWVEVEVVSGGGGGEWRWR